MNSSKTRKEHAPVSAEDSALFRQSIGSITPLKQSRVSHPKPRTRSHHRQQPPKNHHHHLIEPNEIRPSEKNLRRQLKKGLIPIDGQLDLHGKTQLQAENALKQFLQQALYMNIYCVLIIHGKGYNSADNIPVLRELTHYILSQEPKVVFYSNAIARHGGSGATYAILRQNHL
ncbi:hypothetical protein MNBD_GAMMA18-839 [hydrothermal vent metagenome]|uniref:Smr domain-containing protein n=1 Tax=hydrothermal vent metagenome TaxID=652676 RepID=A0A3B0Z5K3_9ZZZZ